MPMGCVPIRRSPTTIHEAASMSMGHIRARRRRYPIRGRILEFADYVAFHCFFDGMVRKRSLTGHVAGNLDLQWTPRGGRPLARVLRELDKQVTKQEQRALWLLSGAELELQNRGITGSLLFLVGTWYVLHRGGEHRGTGGRNATQHRRLCHGNSMHLWRWS